MFKNKKHLFLGAALAAAIFIIDWVTPAGLAVWIAYILVLAVVAKDLRPGQIVGAAGGLITLTYIGFFLETHAFGPAISLLNRTFGSAAIAILAYRIIKHRRADETLREMDENYRSLVENSPFGSYILQDDRLVYANKSFCELTGYDAEDLFGMDVLDLAPPDEREADAELLAKIKSGEIRELNVERRGVRRNGKEFHAHITGDKGVYRGRPAFLGRVFDITERKRAEEERLRLIDDLNLHREELTAHNEALMAAQREIEESRRKYANLYRFAPVGYMTLDKDGNITEMNETASRMLGDGIKFTGRPLLSFIPPEHRDAFMAHIRETLSNVMAKTTTCEIKLIKADGGWFFAQCESMREEGGRIKLAMIDVTERRAARAEAEEGKRLLDALMDNISEGIIIADAPDLKIRAASRRLLDLIDIDTYPEIANIEALKDKWVFYSHEGKPVPAGEMPLQRTASTGETIENEELFMADPDGGMKLISVNASPIRDEDGKIIAVITSWRDVTGVRQAEEMLFQALEREKEARAGAEEALAERKRAEDELKDSEERLRRALIELKELESARADFASMLTHDLKSPLGTITGYAELLEGMCAEMPEAKGMVESIQRSAEKMLNMVQDFLTVSRLEDGRMKLSVKNADISAILDRIYGDFLPAAEKSGVKLEKDYGGLPRACVDARYIERSLGNLLQNALAHTPEGGRVVLKAESGAREGQRRRGPFIGFTVQDTGTGIPEDYRERIFDRYYTAAKSGTATGSGLGLAIVKAVAEAHGGRAAVESEPGKGSSFHIYMPLRSECLPN